MTVGTIVPMAERHLTEIARLERQCFSRPWSEAGLRAELSDPTACFLVAVQEERLLGYAGMHAVCGEGYVANVAVSPSDRRQGVGRALVRALIAEAERQKLEFLSLEVRPSNRAAVTLYRSEGFREVGRRKNFYAAPPEDGLILTRYFG